MNKTWSVPSFAFGCVFEDRLNILKYWRNYLVVERFPCVFSIQLPNSSLKEKLFSCLLILEWSKCRTQGEGGTGYQTWHEDAEPCPCPRKLMKLSVPCSVSVPPWWDKRGYSNWEGGEKLKPNDKPLEKLWSLALMGCYKMQRKDREKGCSMLTREGSVWSICDLECPKCHLLSQEGLIGGHSSKKICLACCTRGT